MVLGLTVTRSYITTGTPLVKPILLLAQLSNSEPQASNSLCLKVGYSL